MDDIHKVKEDQVKLETTQTFLREHVGKLETTMEEGFKRLTTKLDKTEALLRDAITRLKEYNQSNKSISLRLNTVENNQIAHRIEYLKRLDHLETTAKRSEFWLSVKGLGAVVTIVAFVGAFREIFFYIIK